MRQMKLKERGRAKYRPLKEYNKEQVPQLLFDKIMEEEKLIQNIESDFELPNLD
jgi:DNA (cytosine-5)-methyltransferase 1